MIDSQKMIIDAAADGALILTVNKRLYRYLRDLFEQEMLAKGEKVWATPQIASYESWLSQSLSDLGEGWRLLSQQQQKCLWEEAITISSHGSQLELLQLSKTAEKALQAHQLLNQYCLTLDNQRLTEDQQAFSLWQQHYKKLCLEQEWLDQSDLPARIIAALELGQIQSPEKVLLFGFDQFSPSLVQLMDCFRSLGARCQIVSVDPGKNIRISRFGARNSRDEIESAARWVRFLLDSGAESIGVVVPDLHLCRRQIERVFRHQIDPASTISLDADDSVFSLSLGGPLAEQGVVYAALEFLSVNHQVTLEQISFLLRTPYLDGAQHEADHRALFDKRLRSFRQQTFTLSGLISLLTENAGLKVFSTLLRALQKNLQNNEKYLPGTWAIRFADELHALGWPGERSLVSSEYQAIKVWQEKALSVLVSLDPLLPALTRQRALSLLRRISSDIEFQLEGPSGPVQVVGLLESSGLQFDHLWVMGMGETSLPARPQPNPFIPLKLQQLNDMPHSSSARELEFSEQVIARIKASSSDIVFSYPLRDGDCDLRPSPLIPLPTVENQPALSPFNDLSSLMQAASEPLQYLDDQTGPPLRQKLVEGGTNLLKDQAHCPFRAFIHCRLQAQGFSVPEPGISPIARGDLVHLTLENVWKELKNLDNLLKLSDQERGDMVKSKVAVTFKTYFKGRTQPPEKLLKLEADRIAILIGEWLENVEMKREYFQVLETEKQHVEQIGSLKISIQIDRIDQLENGRCLVIDYKTGVNLHAEDLLSQPLIEPQLPIYAVADTQSVIDAVVFAKVRRGESRFIGIVKEKGQLGRVRDLQSYSQAKELSIHGWNELLLFWQQQLEQLADDFASGKAVVKPYDLVKSCQYCDLSGLCRIGETFSVIGGSDDC
ncbi:probable DNA repair protein [Desulfuromusa kysingii]|uniref:Probable DNA repair protein n=1 Tax=Desulfuromusa kysingii TaxID=37625 RepID=A0A1H4BGS6_9BACT|nr:PD-(D/E)XK nuclease family protein [Desulfuromusa kysingii]SEA47297.1 probable DNA repair protein [Desulfuromusa kysingii]